MAAKYLKDLETRQQTCVSLASELAHWRYILNEGGVIAMQKPEASPIIRSQTYINATAKDIADFLSKPANYTRWDPLCEACVPEDQTVSKGVTIMFRRARYVIAPEQNLRTAASYVLLRSNYQGKVCLLGCSDPNAEPADVPLMEFRHFSFLLEPQGDPTDPSTKVTFLWQAQSEGLQKQMSASSLLTVVGSCTGRIKAALESK